MFRIVEIGVGLTGLGFLFLFLGVVFFFDRGLLAMGNVRPPPPPALCLYSSSTPPRRGAQPPPLPLPQVLVLAGVAMTIGAQATLKFFIRPKNYKGSGFFLGGVSLVVWGWTLVGFALEAYGFWLLFSAFFPTALSFLRRMPFLRQLLDTPAFKGVSSLPFAG